MQEKTKTYTSSDFARYHSGTMPPNEMHALERAALEDPFLADALEGYENTREIKNDIEELRLRLTGSSRKKNIFSIASLAQNKWWSVAVLFIIILGIGYFMYRPDSVNTKDSLAKNDTKKSLPKIEAPSPVLKDTGTVNNDIAFEKSKAPQLSKKNTSALPKTNAAIEQKEVMQEAMANADKAAASSRLLRENYEADTTNSRDAEIDTNSQVPKEYVLKGKVIDETGTPIPYVSIKAENQNKVIITDTSGQFSLTSPDSSTNIVASAVGFKSKNMLLKKDMQPIVTMNRTSLNLDEVVVTGYANQRKKALSSASKNVQGRAAGVDITKPVPFAVNEKFTQYLQDNILPVYDANNERLHGEVLLSFSVNKKGRPGHIKVLQSTCKGGEEQALQLLKNGPDWNVKKNIRGSVIIKF